MKVRIPRDFTPRPYQKKYMEFYDRGGKRGFWVWPRRNGKDLTAANQTAKMAVERVANYWHAFPTLEQGRKALWENIRRDGKRTLDTVFPGFSDPKHPHSLIKRKNDQQMFLELKNGSIWRIIGTDKVENTGAGPAGIVFSEFAQMRPTVWDFLRPMLRETGGWASFITTPRGHNHAKKLFEMAVNTEGWAWDLQTVETTNVEYESDRRPGQMLGWREMVAEERESGMQEALIRQEYFCDWTAANLGAVWGDLIEALEKRGGIGAFDHQTDGIYTSWDLGHTDATCVLFWRLNEHRVPDLIDHYEAHGKPMSHYFDVVDAKGYRYETHWLPHDARAKTLQTGSSIVEQALQHWPGQVTITPQLSIEDGIQAGRWLLQQPVRIHSRCGEGIEALRRYHYHFDDDTRAFGMRPEHDWSSHTADAFRYLACVVKYTDAISRKPEGKKMPPPRGINSFTMDELWALRDRDVRGRS